MSQIYFANLKTRNIYITSDACWLSGYLRSYIYITDYFLDASNDLSNLLDISKNKQKSE